MLKKSCGTSFDYYDHVNWFNDFNRFLLLNVIFLKIYDLFSFPRSDEWHKLDQDWLYISTTMKEEGAKCMLPGVQEFCEGSKEECFLLNFNGMYWTMLTILRMICFSCAYNIRCILPRSTLTQGLIPRHTLAEALQGFYTRLLIKLFFVYIIPYIFLDVS